VLKTFFIALRKNLPIMKKILLSVLIFSLCIQNQSYAQKGKDVALGIGALAVGAIAVAASIENNKEIYEKEASDYLIQNFDFEQFSLKMLAIDAKKKLSDKGNLYIIPFAFVELKYGIETDNRKVLLAFFQTNQVSNNGVDFTNVVYELIDNEEWNSIICSYAMLNSPVRLKITNKLVPVFKFDQKISFKKKIPELIQIPNFNDSDYAFVKLSKRKLAQYKRDNVKSFINISELSISSTGLYHSIDSEQGYFTIMYPFFNLKGDDYLSTDYSDKYKLLSNENAMGIFLKSANESLLIGNSVLNRIHMFINAVETYKKPNTKMTL